jgi:TonB family protein
MKRMSLRLSALVLAALAIFSGAAVAQEADEAAAWQRVSASGTAEQLKAFLDEFPAGTFAAEARQKYSTMTSGMLPPEVKDIEVRFPLDARRVGRTVGPMRVVKLDILVQPDGKAREVEVSKSSGYDRYDSAARQAAREATYLPGLDRGMAVESRMEYDVSFGLLCNRAAGTRPDCDGGRFPQECSATVCAPLLR